MPGVRIVHYHFVFDDEAESFARQLEYFAANFEPVALSEAVARLTRGDATGNELAVTFDDGFRNQALIAAPLLAEAGFRACFFLITELVGAEPPDARRVCRERLHLPLPVEPMTWADAATLVEQGHEIGSHTASHPNLAALPGAEVERELISSKTELEQQLGVDIAHVSAPYGGAGRFSAAVAAAARAAGYSSCSTAFRGRNTDRDVYALRRDHLVAGWPLRHVRYFLSR